MSTFAACWCTLAAGSQRARWQGAGQALGRKPASVATAAAAITPCKCGCYVPLPSKESCAVGYKLVGSVMCSGIQAAGIGMSEGQLGGCTGAALEALPARTGGMHALLGASSLGQAFQQPEASHESVKLMPEDAGCCWKGLSRVLPMQRSVGRCAAGSICSSATLPLLCLLFPLCSRLSLRPHPLWSLGYKNPPP